LRCRSGASALSARPRPPRPLSALQLRICDEQRPRSRQVRPFR
jgi:hypothetical protein